MLKRNVPEPSTKNGRRSGKNVSNASRLTTAGSASTWPKSGFAVAVSVRPGVTRVLQVETDRAARIGRARSADCRRRPGRVSTLPSVYGISSKRLRRARHLQAAHLAELRDEAVGVARQQRPGRRLGEAADLANHREAHRAAVGVVEAQLRERNAELGAPAVGVLRDLRRPTPRPSCRRSGRR